MIVDLAAETGGNCGAGPGPARRWSRPTVTILGPVNLPATMPLHASQMLSRNVLTLLQHLLTKEGQLVVSMDDEITGAMCLVTPARSDEPPVGEFS